MLALLVVAVQITQTEVILYLILLHQQVAVAVGNKIQLPIMVKLVVLVAGEMARTTQQQVLEPQIKVTTEALGKPHHLIGAAEAVVALAQ